MSLNMVRVNAFVTSRFDFDDKVKIRSMLLHLIKNRSLTDDVINDLNKIIELEDIMDDPVSEAMKLITKAYNDNK